MSAAGTVCESMIAAVGHRFRPARTRVGRAARPGWAATPAAGPAGEHRVHRRGWRELYRQVPPRDTTAHDVQDGVHHHTAAMLLGSSAAAVLPGAGNSGSRIAHSASVTDDEYTAQPCPPAAWGGHDGHGQIGDGGIVGAASDVGVVMVMTVYFLADMPRIRATLYRLVPNSRRPRAILIGDEILAKVGQYVFGNVLTSLIAGAATVVWCLVFDIPYPVLLGVFVAILDLFRTVPRSQASWSRWSR